MMFAHGHAVAPDVAPFPVYNALFGAIASEYLDDGIFDHTVHVPAGDPALDEAWSNLGFGRFAAVAARSTSPLRVEVGSTEVRLATSEDVEHVYRLAAAGNAYHAEAPMFVPYMDPYAEQDVREDLRQGLEDTAQAFFLGFADGEPAGLLRVEQAKGSPLFVPDDACYIGDTAVLALARGSGVGTAVLEAALAEARERGHNHVTLHYQVQNPLASAFWAGHGFEPVMYHMRRRLDERIAWARPR
jgi:ribosomal protein S18 acetylase RimI-like enzyme